MKITFSADDLCRAFDMANRVAPTTKGGAWDVAAGMVMEVAEDGTTTVRATDLDTSMHMKIKGVFTGKAEAVMWRMSSLFLAPFATKLSGDITVEQKAASYVTFRSGKSKLKVLLMKNDDYPAVQPPPTTPSVEGNNLKELADRVSWSCDDSNRTGILTGLHIDGKVVVGCRHESLAILDLPLEIPTPITFPARQLISLVRGFDDVRISATESMVFLWLNETDWVSSKLLVEAYPQFRRLIRDTVASHVTVNRNELLDSLERMSIIASMDRGNMPRMEVTITKDTLHLKVEVKDVADTEESITASGHTDEEPFTSAFSMGTFRDAVSRTNSDTITIGYGDTKDPAMANRRSIKVTDGSGWEASLMPRKPRS